MKREREGGRKGEGREKRGEQLKSTTNTLSGHVNGYFYADFN